jgi:predicted transcriptional regulator
MQDSSEMPADAQPSSDTPERGMTKNQRKILQVLAQADEGIRYNGLVVATKLSKGSLSNAIQSLLGKGCISHEDRQPYFITDAGRTALQSSSPN